MLVLRPECYGAYVDRAIHPSVAEKWSSSAGQSIRLEAHKHGEAPSRWRAALQRLEQDLHQGGLETSELRAKVPQTKQGHATAAGVQYPLVLGMKPPDTLLELQASECRP